MSYQLQHQESINNPEQYWRRQASKLAWYQQPTQTLSYTDGNDPESYQWFADGELNLSYLTLDYHVEHGRGTKSLFFMIRL